MSISPGDRLGPYEVLAPLGAGGMGEVWKARDPRLEREVAIKVLPTSFSKDPDRLRRFEQEAKAASALNHPNILTMHDIGTQDGSPYVVSELLEGETLRSRLAGGAFAPRKALGHALQIAHGLSAAHEKGIVHRDLKPENIFVTRDGRVKILDFGLAKLTEASGAVARQTDLPTQGTEAGMVLGTLGYMSPEQVRGKPADPRSDIFSFGAILYEMLSGRRAFHGDTSADTMSAILTRDPPDLSATNRQVSPGLDRIVRHCLEKDPERRFHSAHDLAFDLEALSDASTAVTQGSAAKPGSRARLLWLAAAVVFTVAALAAVVLLRKPRAASIDSLAVLPFVNGSGDANSEYLSEGITNNLTNDLSQFPGLRVTARTIASHYRGKDTDPQKAGRDLGVQAVLTGKVAERDGNLIVYADLVNVGTGAQLWGGQFNRKLADIQALQEEIAAQISSRLRITLTGEQKKLLIKRRTENAEAYQAYLKGRYYFEHRNEKTLELAAQQFNLAIEKDPAFAPAYSGLAECYVVMPSYFLKPPKEALPRARAAASRALELDDTLADPHATLGSIAGQYDWDWPTAEREFRLALELKPSYPATTHLWYALVLSAESRHEQAVEQTRLAMELDPLAAVIQWNLARILFYARRFDEAIEASHRGVELGPTTPWSHYWSGRAYLVKGMTAEAVLEFQKATALAPNDAIAIFFADGLARCGKRRDALDVLERLNSTPKAQYVSPAVVAKVYVGLGDREQAITWLERAYEDHSWDLIFFNVDPFFDDVRTDPRFADLMRRIHLAK